MKKIIAITAMAAAVAGFSFADEPTADVSIAEVSGNASVTWGGDLDNNFSSGFKNEGEATLKVNFANKGTKSTEGDGIWGELGVEVTQNVGFKSHTGSTDESGIGGWDGDNGGKIKVSAAKLHFGPVYVGITKGDTKVGDFKVPNAIMSADNDNAIKIGGVGADASQGIVAGYGDDNFGLDVDFRSNAPAGGKKAYVVFNKSTYAVTYELAGDDGSSTNVNKDGSAKDGYEVIKTIEGVGAGNNFYNNNYGFAAEAQLKDSNAFVPGLFAKVGFAMPFTNNPVIGIGASAGYKLAIGESFYLKPTVAYNAAIVSAGGTPTVGQGLVGGVLFGWGDTADANAGVPYLDNDQTKKVTPGVGVALAIDGLGSTAVTTKLVPSFYSGDLIPNLKAGVVAELNLGNATNFSIAGGAKYTLAVGDSVKISPYGGARFISNGASTSVFGVDNKNNAGNSDRVKEANDNILNVKAGVELGGLISNTTFDVWYQSCNLTNTGAGAKAGTINLKCKIAL